jgi:hypothetical protein
MTKGPSLEDELKREFPELHFVTFKGSKESDIESPEFLSAIKYIKENKLIQAAENALSDNEFFRESVSYPIVFSDNQKRELFFKVGWADTLDKYIGFIQSLNDSGEKVNQVRMYGMRLEK